MGSFFSSIKDREPIERIDGVKIWSAYLDNTMLTYMEFAPGSELPEHRHDHEQITLVLEGKMEMVVGGERRTVGKGDVIAVPSGVLHRARVFEEFTVAVDSWSPIREDYK